MLETFVVRPSVRSRLQRGPLGPYLPDLAKHLREEHYAPDTIRRILHATDQFGEWLQHHGYTPAQADEVAVAQYRRSVGRSASGQLPKVAQGVTHIVPVLRQHGIVSPLVPSPSSTEAEQWLCRFATYLEQVKGASRGTRCRYLAIARRFLTACFGAGPVDWQALSPAPLTSFLQREAATKQGHGRKVLGVALRALLRFLVFNGSVRPGLEAAVLLPRQWTHAALPRQLTTTEVTKVLATCQGTTPKALRNSAILLLLARLGLRALEIVRLQLDDIDWHGGQLYLRPGKTHQARLLPFSQEIGDALVAYLTAGRPASSSRVVFLTCRPPFRPFADASTVTHVAKRAILRTGFPDRRLLGAHTFRHTVASQLITHGVSFKEVADVLGHRSLQTTGIYAKLDLPALTAIALPWQGGEQ